MLTALLVRLLSFRAGLCQGEPVGTGTHHHGLFRPDSGLDIERQAGNSSGANSHSAPNT